MFSALYQTGKAANTEHLIGGGALLNILLWHKPAMEAMEQSRPIMAGCLVL
jgi:hypothetical protein